MSLHTRDDCAWYIPLYNSVCVAVPLSIAPCYSCSSTGTAPLAMVDHGTSPVAVPDPSDALHSELAAAQQEALLLAQQLQASRDKQHTREGEVMR